MRSFIDVDVFVSRDSTCRDDPYGIVAAAPFSDCVDLKKTGQWSCPAFDPDFNGHSVYVWELCPKSCQCCILAGFESDHDDGKTCSDPMEQLPSRRPNPECKIREDCRWCTPGWDITEKCKNGICYHNEADKRCIGKNNGFKLKKGGSCWGGKREERCQDPLGPDCITSDDCKRKEYCKEFDAMQGAPSQNKPVTPQRVPAQGSKDGQRKGQGSPGFVPVHVGPAHDRHHPNGPEGDVFPVPPGGSRCAPCSEVVCSNEVDLGEAEVCCDRSKPINGINDKLSVLSIVLITICSVLFCVMFVAIGLFVIRDRRLHREIAYIRQNYERPLHPQVNQHRMPAPAVPAPAHTPGANVVQVQPTVAVYGEPEGA